MAAVPPPVQSCPSGLTMGKCWWVKAVARPCPSVPDHGASQMAAPCLADHAVPWLRPALKRRGPAHRPRWWARPNSCLCSVTKRARASSPNETCRWAGGGQEFSAALIWSSTVSLCVFRGYRPRCRCPPNSWRRFLRAWTGWAMDSWPPMNSTLGLVSTEF